MAASPSEVARATPRWPKVDVVLLGWRQADKTVTALRSLVACGYANLRVIVVDNGSDDGADVLVWQELQRLWPAAQRIEHPDDRPDPAVLRAAPVPAVFVRSYRNRGYAGGMNLGLAVAASVEPGRYFWLLANDVVVSRGAVESLVRRCEEDPTIGLCGATQRVHGQQGELVRTIPGGVRYLPALALDVPVVRRRWRGGRPVRTSIERRINCLQGAAVFGTRRFLDEVGPLGSDRFLYFEEAEWATRARRAGFRVAWAPDALIANQHSVTMAVIADPAARQATSGYLLARGAMVFTRRFHRRLVPVVLGVRALRSLLDLFRKGPLVARWTALGAWDGVTGRHRRPPLLAGALLPTEIELPASAPGRARTPTFASGSSN